MAKAKNDAVQQPLLFDFPAAPQIENQRNFSLSDNPTFRPDLI